MTPGKLGATLFSMYDGALPGEKTTMIHLFGVKYAAEIRDCGASVTEIVRLSGIDGSYNREVDGAVKSRFLMRVGWVIIVHVYFTRPTDRRIV